MGQAIMRSLQSHDDLKLAALWIRHRERAAGLPDHVVASADLDTVVAGADVLIDFSLPEATDRVLATVARQGKALVCGVSGLSGVSLINGIVVWWGIPINTAAPEVWEAPGLPYIFAGWAVGANWMVGQIKADFISRIL